METDAKTPPFQLILESEEAEELSEQWQKQCCALYNEINRSITEGSIGLLTCKSAEGKRAGIINILSAYGLSIKSLEHIFYILKVWLESRPKAKVLMKFSNGNMIEISGETGFSKSEVLSLFEKSLQRTEKAQEETDKIKKEEKKKQKEKLQRQREETEQKQREEKRKREEKEANERKGEEEQKRKGLKEIEKEGREKIEKVPLPSDEVDRIVKEEFNRLSEGQITFIVAKKMKAGVAENVKANIGKNLSQIDEKVANLYLSRKIKVSSSMKVSLTGEGDNFNIQIITPEIQPIIGENITTWEWIIKPQKSGIQKLLLSVEVIIEVPQYSDRKYHLTTLEENIEVKVNPKYYLECHWKWIIATIITVLSVIIGVIFKK